MPDMCAECAFRRGNETWHEPRNRLVSQICAAGPLPFLCHRNLDWENPVAHILSVRGLAEITGERVRMCEGWRRAVAARRWPRDAMLRLYQRWLAKDALETADRFLTGMVSVRAMQRVLTPLAEFYRGPRAWQIARMVGK